MIFVFGSNAKGIHGKGAALYAAQYFGAQHGVGRGRTGDSYALPTKLEPYKNSDLAFVKNSVEEFLVYARKHPQEIFQVCRVGCQNAGFTDEEVAPMFYNAPKNCRFDDLWFPYLPKAIFWGTWG